MPLPGAAKTVQPGFAQRAADWRSGPRWSILSVLCPVHPFPLRGTSPQGETRDMREKTASHILHVPFRRFPPLVAVATTFPPQFGGAAKGKRLNGQARRLTSPHLEVLCRTSTGDYKAPLCCELLMKGLLCGSLLSHRSAGGRWCRKAPKGGKSHRRWLVIWVSCYMIHKVNPVTLTLYSSPDRAIPQPSA